MGRGTENSVEKLLEKANTSEKNYVLEIFLDIAGAFDNAWWPKIIVQLHDFRVNRKELGVVKDYFRERYAILLKKKNCFQCDAHKDR